MALKNFKHALSFHRALTWRKSKWLAHCQQDKQQRRSSRQDQWHNASWAPPREMKANGMGYGPTPQQVYSTPTSVAEPWNMAVMSTTGTYIPCAPVASRTGTYTKGLLNVEKYRVNIRMQWIYLWFQNYILEEAAVTVLHSKDSW